MKCIKKTIEKKNKYTHNLIYIYPTRATHKSPKPSTAVPIAPRKPRAGDDDDNDDDDDSSTLANIDAAAIRPCRWAGPASCAHKRCIIVFF